MPITLAFTLRGLSRNPDVHFTTSFCGYTDSNVSWWGTVTSKTSLNNGYVYDEFDYTGGGRSEQDFGNVPLTDLPANTVKHLNVSGGWSPSDGRVTGGVHCSVWYSTAPPGRGKA